ncbi:MAG: ATP-binding protein [Mariniblastus sp.]
MTTSKLDLVIRDPRATRRFSKRLTPMPRETDTVDKTAEWKQAIQRCVMLERQLHEKNRQLKAMYRRMKNARQEFQQFTEAVSHDLHAPLRAVAGFCQFLKEDYRGKLDETADGYIDRVVEGTVRMKRLLEGLVGFSRITTNNAPFEIVDLQKIAQNTIDKMHHRIRDLGATVNIIPSLPLVMGNPKQISILLENLIDNSMKFHDESTNIINIFAKQNDQEWTIGVSDNGIGIAKELQECVFQMFRRLNAAQKHEGAGSGLPTCRRIVERHSGRIWVESENQQGSTFYFTIPSAPIEIGEKIA